MFVMLSRAYRLTKQRDVERAARQGRPVHVRALTVRAVRNTVPTSRFAVVVGLKVSKRAVVRNRAKRLIREAIRSLIPMIRPGADVVIHAKPTIVDFDLAAMSEDLKNALYRANVLLSPRVDSMGTSRTMRRE